MRLYLVPVLLLSLAACSALPGRKAAPADPGLATEFASPVQTQPLAGLGSGQSVAALDTTSAAEKQAALAAGASGGALGTQVVALGSPADAGLWVQTSLVSKVQKGSVRAPNGKVLAVELRPGSGAALMSLSAYQALGISLTDLPQMTILGS
ncbi:hypothetical protein Q9295_09895 [Xinfangfangia sp. CPCC 101601]|uniref:D-galactarate dehydratase n=1 Tax=Pseudogemmobacter lacusdianii TaxID=3069608 RepID=A0ABU0VYT3_9RHOB|nr:hypothetical protein [Xinfangfangia sp. CPCC 101601]MDQ2066688.1 hypothetical protein [Xinfangfangia sp. CPCC 101601]